MSIDGTNNNSINNAFRKTAPAPTETKFVDGVERKVSNLQPESIKRTSTRQLRAQTVRQLGAPSRAAKKEESLRQTPRRPTVPDVPSANRTTALRPTETKFVDKVPSREKSQPKPAAQTSARQFGPQIVGTKRTSSPCAPAAAPKVLSVDQNQNIQIESDTALVKSSMVEKRVSMNNHDWKKGEHVDDATIAKFTPKENIADGEDTVFLDQNGNFICSIAYDAIQVPDDAIDVLGKVPRSNRERGPAGGPIDREAMDKFYEDLNEKRANSKNAKTRAQSNQWVEYSNERPWVAYLNGNKRKKRGNAHFSTSFGCARSYKNPAEVDGSKGDKKKKYEIVKPYFKLISDCFEEKWSDQYRSYTQEMKKIGGDTFYLADSVFSSIAVNTHEIASNGEVLKDARAAIHKDSGHHVESYEVMLCLSKNVEGGDLYLPEFGILLKLRHKCVVCFRAKLYKHAVTEIKRKKLDSTALRVTLVAYMANFADDTLNKAIQSTLSGPQLTPQSISPRFKPSDFEEGGEEEIEPAAPSQELKRRVAKERKCGISTPTGRKKQASPDLSEGVMRNFAAAQKAAFAGLVPPPQGLLYPQLFGASVNPMPGYVPHHVPYCFDPNVPFIPANGGISHAQQIRALQDQLSESYFERDLLKKQILAMRTLTAYSQVRQQPLFRSEEPKEDTLNHAASTVWHTETSTSTASTEDRGVKRPFSELNPGQYLGSMPLEKQARLRRQ